MLRYWEKDMENTKKNIFKSNEVMMLFVLIAIFGPVIYPVDPLKQSVMQKYGPITWEHPLGTDNLGRDRCV